MITRIAVGGILLPIFPVRRAPVLNVRPAPAVVEKKVVTQNCVTTKPEQFLNVFDGGEEGVMTNQLTREEIVICRETGTPVDEYVAARARKLLRQIPTTATPQERMIAVHSAGARPARVHSLNPVFENILLFQRTRNSGNLRAAQAALKTTTGIAAAAFLTPAEMQVCVNCQTDPARFAIRKKQTATSTAIMMATHGQSVRTDTEPGQEADPETCLENAMADIQNFLKDSSHLESLQHLISASSWLNQAMRIAGATVRRAGGWE